MIAVAAGRRAALAAALLLGAAPLTAQTEAETAVAPEGGPAWTEAASDAFFTGPDRLELRPMGEIRARWDALSAAAQEEVRRDCAAIAMDAQDVQGAASGGVLDSEGAVLPGAESAPPPASEAEATAAACAIVGSL